MILVYPGSVLSRKEDRNRLNALFANDRPCWISDGQLDLPIEKLMEEVQNSKSSDSENQKLSDSASLPPMMYVAGKDREELEAMLDILEENGFSDLLMAASTPNNMTWTLRELASELADEKRVFDKRKRLEQLIQEADRERLMTEPKYAQAVMTCYQMLSAEDFPEKLLDMAIAMLEAANQNI